MKTIVPLLVGLVILLGLWYMLDSRQSERSQRVNDAYCQSFGKNNPDCPH